eukprot:scaffold17030_cov150-Isochrysis_galbana.AAC.1
MCECRRVQSALSRKARLRHGRRAMALLRPETRPTSFSQSVKCAPGTRIRGRIARRLERVGEEVKGKKSAPHL